MDYCEFIEQFELSELDDSRIMREATQLVRECRAQADALDAFEEDAFMNGYRIR